MEVKMGHLASDIFIKTKVRQAMAERGLTDPTAVAAVVDIVKEIEAGLIDITDNMQKLVTDVLMVQANPMLTMIKEH